jgi:hypothetical protein
VKVFIKDREKMGMMFELLKEKEEKEMKSNNKRNLSFY